MIARSLVLPLLLTLVSCASAPAPAPKPTMAAPTAMSPAARLHFKTVMNEHGDDMTVLMWSILFLDVETAVSASESIKKMKWLERPAEGQDPKFDVPPLIYDIQDELLAKTNELSEIARSGVREPEVLATAFGNVANTCVKCHSYYLYKSGVRRGEMDAKGQRDEGK